MEHQTNQGQKFAILLLASSILIAGLFVGGSILAKNNANGSDPRIDAVSSDTHPQQVSQPVQQQVPGCGI